jgi:di/tricarboxylate transporter
MVVVFASTALVLLVILLLRLTDIAFDSVRDWLDNEGPTMWLAYGFWGALFTILGLVFLAKARSATKGS